MSNCATFCSNGVNDSKVVLSYIVNCPLLEKSQVSCNYYLQCTSFMSNNAPLIVIIMKTSPKLYCEAYFFGEESVFT